MSSDFYPLAAFTIKDGKEGVLQFPGGWVITATAKKTTSLPGRAQIKFVLTHNTKEKAKGELYVASNSEIPLENQEITFGTDSADIRIEVGDE